MIRPRHIISEHIDGETSRAGHYISLNFGRHIREKVKSDYKKNSAFARAMSLAVSRISITNWSLCSMLRAGSIRSTEA